ncbi:MAG: hypothetical protein IPF69_01680 [Chitinophagaceae bacterium]|nr:hypothetical protein [Chitinophagaceae bacterium]MBK8301100.1 hypothetical protein [Chitinophagaceae bacterium]MBK9660776.1 hypothetical protein [Chitinophagaceae bacterium]MBL0068893.1 hypothetical protein [Chitinophagaceae bacterium]MBP6232705.1 hypothetical protein [Chitinophagaceae bacterium]
MAISVSSRKDLETRILELEKIQARQVLELKRSAVDIVESLTPANIIKSALKNVAQSPDIRTSVINTAIGIGAGFLGNKLIVGKSSNIFKRIIGSTLQFGIANFIRKKIPQIQENHHLQEQEA